MTKLIKFLICLLFLLFPTILSNSIAIVDEYNTLNDSQTYITFSDANNYKEIEKYVYPLVVKNDEGKILKSASAVLVEDGKLLTAKHAVVFNFDSRKNSEQQIDLEKVKNAFIVTENGEKRITNIKLHTLKDEALLTVDDLPCPCVKIALLDDIKENINGVAIGYPFYFRMGSEFISECYLYRKEGYKIFSKITIMPGMSGGGLFIKKDFDWYLVGILSETKLEDNKLFWNYSIWHEINLKDVDFKL